MKPFLFVLLTLLASSTGAAECDSISGSDRLFRPGHVVLLGEIHGTNESPQSVSDLVCQALGKGLAVTVGLELPKVGQQRVDEFLISAGDSADVAQLISGFFWQRDYQDGRASQAMVKLIDDVRKYKSDSANDIQIILIDNPDARKGRDHFMASRLSDEITRAPENFVIALTGNLHNQLVTGEGFDPEIEPMGYLVSQMQPKITITSLELLYTGGQAWISNSAGNGPAPIGGVEGKRGIYYYHKDEHGPYTGIFQIGQASASLPAKDR